MRMNSTHFVDMIRINGLKLKDRTDEIGKEIVMAPYGVPYQLWDLCKDF